MSDYTVRVVSPQEALAEVYPFVLVNEDGTARELHASEREYLETPFLPNDSSRPYVKRHYRSMSRWFGISGFCRRSQLPAGMQVAAAPTEDPTRRLTIDDIRDELRRRYEAPQSPQKPESPAARAEPGADGERRPAEAVRPHRTVAEPAAAEQGPESPTRRMPWKFGVGLVGTVVFVLLRSALHHPQLKDHRQRQPPIVRPDQGRSPDGRESIASEGVSREDVVRRINEHRFASIVSCQRRLGISDEALDTLLRRAWRSQFPDGQPPWESKQPEGSDWRTSVTWNVEAVEQVLERMAAGKQAVPAVQPR